jgi:thiol:disulfide interchange protein
MKKLSLLLVAGFVTTMFLDSCSIQQRYHRKGLTVSWKNTSIHSKKDKSVKSEVVVNEIETSEVAENRQVEIPKITENKSIIVTTNSDSFKETSTETQVVSPEKIDEVQSPKTNTSATTLEEQKNVVSKSSVQAQTSEKLKKENKKSNISNDEGGQSWIVAILLCFFIGFLGIHRFYLGYTGLGILYLLTGGLCGVGVLIDFILLLVGGLKPKNGDYSDR